MDRRNFLKGTFGGITAGGILIAAANTDIEAFATDLDRKAQIDIATPGTIPSVPFTGEMVFNSSGQPIGIITGVHFHQKVERAEFIDGTVHHYPGLKSFELTVQSYGAFSIEPYLHQHTK